MGGMGQASAPGVRAGGRLGGGVELEAGPASAPEARLWAAVLLRQLLDLAGPPGGVQAEAERWLGAAPDFSLVCRLAGYEPEAVRRGLARARAAARPMRLTRAPAHWTRVCALPGCGALIAPDNVSGLCFPHRHAKGLCRCRACLRAAA